MAANTRRTVIGVGVAILGLMLFFALLVLGPNDQGFATTANRSDSLAASSQPSALLLEASAGVPVRASLDKDLDNDGHLDGVADESLALSVVVIFFAFNLGGLLIPLLGVTSTFLGVYYKALKLGCAYYPPLEHPG